MDTNSGLQAGGTANPSADNASTTEQQNQTPPLTKEQLDVVEKLVQEQATRIAQSFVDKAANRISKEAQAQIEALKLTQSALGLTDEQVEQAADKIVMRDLKAARQEPASSQPTPQQQAPTDVHPAIAKTLEVFKMEGITIETSDPEYKALDDILRDPNGNEIVYMRELFKQINAKRQRIATNQQAAPARVVSGGQSQNDNAPRPSRARDYLTQAHRK